MMTRTILLGIAKVPRSTSGTCSICKVQSKRHLCCSSAASLRSLVGGESISVWLSTGLFLLWNPLKHYTSSSPTHLPVDLWCSTCATCAIASTMELPSSVYFQFYFNLHIPSSSRDCSLHMLDYRRVTYGETYLSSLNVVFEALHQHPCAPEALPCQLKFSIGSGKLVARYLW